MVEIYKYWSTLETFVSFYATKARLQNAGVTLLRIKNVKDALEKSTWVL
jgi:hypothetical protein